MNVFVSTVSSSEYLETWKFDSITTNPETFPILLNKKDMRIYFYPNPTVATQLRHTHWKPMFNKVGFTKIQPGVLDLYVLLKKHGLVNFDDSLSKRKLIGWVQNSLINQRKLQLKTEVFSDENKCPLKTLVKQMTLLWMHPLRKPFRYGYTRYRTDET